MISFEEPCDYYNTEDETPCHGTTIIHRIKKSFSIYFYLAIAKFLLIQCEMNAMENERTKKDHARRENNRIEERETNAHVEIELDVDLKSTNASRKNLVVKLRSLLTSSRIWKTYALALVLMWCSETHYAPLQLIRHMLRGQEDDMSYIDTKAAHAT